MRSLSMAYSPKLFSSNNARFAPKVPKIHQPEPGTPARVRARCSAAIWMGRRIAALGMLPDAEPLPHLICSRPIFIGGGRYAQGDRFERSRNGLSPEARDALATGWTAEAAVRSATRAPSLRRRRTRGADRGLGGVGPGLRQA